MEGFYQVYLGNAPAGKVQIIRQGLYYRIQCWCRVEGTQVYRLYAVQGTQRVNLGVLIPEGDGFALDRRISVRQLGEGEPRFVLSTGTVPKDTVFVPIIPEEPFRYISKLKTAFLESDHGKIGVRIQINPGAK